VKFVCLVSVNREARERSADGERFLGVLGKDDTAIVKGWDFYGIEPWRLVSQVMEAPNRVVSSVL
jgi:hypothetical protein